MLHSCYDMASLIILNNYQQIVTEGFHLFVPIGRQSGPEYDRPEVQFRIDIHLCCSLQDRADSFPV